MLEGALFSPSPEPGLKTALPRPFGNYELLEEIARGGMGVVYKARQLGLNRIVAVKMILSGQFAGETELQRFRAEARAVATLQHPGIVAIHEVGENEGQLFFSMDYVEGQNLAQLVREGPLPASRAAQCVQAIAEAIHYAHERGILHRDLKPSNILIDSQGQPHVTDFGLAKQIVATDVRRLTSTSGVVQQNENQSLVTSAATDLTLTGQVLGSPNFMPPEQAAGRHRALTPASDVYSLGALLYHLLTGRPPFLADSIPATLRLVSETEPIPPRLLNPNVPRDLETICLKCLQKDSCRRYGTAAALVEDLGCFLRDEPISARPVDNSEKAWRWCRRNPALAATVAVSVLLLLVVAIGSPIAAFRVDRERVSAEQARQKAERGETKAQTEAAKSQQVAQLFKNMLEGVGPSVALGRDPTLLREILDKTDVQLTTDLKAQPGVEAELRTTLGQVYSDIGIYPKAEKMHRVALTLRKSLLGDEHIDVADSQYNLARAIQSQRLPSRYYEAESLFKQALATQRKFLGNGHADVANTLNSLGLLYRQTRSVDAEALHREALKIMRTLFGLDHPKVATTLDDLGTALMYQKRYAEAEKVQRESLNMTTKLLGSEHPSTANALHTLALTLRQAGQLTNAEALCWQALVIRRKLMALDHPFLADTRNVLASVLMREGKYAEAEPLLLEALNIARRRYTNDPVQLASPVYNLVDALIAQQKSAEAEQLVSDPAFAIPDKPRNAGLFSNRAELLARRGRWKEAAVDMTKAIEIAPTHWLYYELAPLLVAGGDLEAYRQLCQKMQTRFPQTKNPDIAERMAKACLILPSSGADLGVMGAWADTAVTLGKTNRSLPYYQFSKGFVDYRQGQLDNVAEWISQSLVGTNPSDDSRRVESYAVLAMSRYHLKQPEEARAALQKGTEIVDEKLPKLDSGDLGDDWREWIIAQALMVEAKALIEGDGASSAGIFKARK